MLQDELLKRLTIEDLERANAYAKDLSRGLQIVRSLPQGVTVRTIGLNIVLSHEQYPNPYLTEYMNFEYFFARKVSLVMASKVFAFFPGGFGTMDEISEILCLMQEDKMPKMPVFLVGADYWRNFDKVIQKMVSLGLINEKDTKIFEITDDVMDVVKAANKIGHPKISENFYDGFKEASALAREKK